MNFRELKRFLAVVEYGSINKAAAHLNVSQPSLSKDIHELEHRLGVTLLMRTARGVSLTPFGQTIFARAKLIDAEIRKLEQDALALRNVSMGEINAGVVPGFLQSLVLPQATLNLTRSATSLTVNYRFGTRASLIQPLLLGELDFAIVGIEEDDHADELVSRPLVLDRNAIVVRSDHPILQNDAAIGPQLTQYPWLVLQECAPLERMLRTLVRSWGTPFSGNVIRTDSFYFFRSTLAASDCIGLTRYDAARLEKEAGNVVELPLDDAKLSHLLGSHMVGVVYRRETELSTASRALIGEIERLAKEATTAG